MNHHAFRESTFFHTLLFALLLASGLAIAPAAAFAKCKCIPQNIGTVTCEIISNAKCRAAEKESECKPEDENDPIPTCRVECENSQDGVSWMIDQSCAWVPKKGTAEVALALGDGAHVTVSLEDLEALETLYPGVVTRGGIRAGALPQEIVDLMTASD